MDALGLDGPDIRHIKNIKSFVIHISGEGLYGLTITGQQEYGDDTDMYELNPSKHRPSRMLWGSIAKDGCCRIMCFQASPSNG